MKLAKLSAALGLLAAGMLASNFPLFDGVQSPSESHCDGWLQIGAVPLDLPLPAGLRQSLIESYCPQRGVPNPDGRVDGSFAPVVCADCTNTVIAPSQTTLGIAGTARGPLWQIESTNRGARVAGTDPASPLIGLRGPPAFDVGVSPTGGAPGGPSATFYNLGREFPRSVNIDGTAPSAGIVRLPGAVPVYKPNAAGIPRLVGGVGVFIRAPLAANPAAVPDVLTAEFAALQGAGPLAFQGIDPDGAIFLGGILLPYVKGTSLPAGRVAGPTAPVPAPGGAGWIVDPLDGEVAPPELARRPSPAYSRGIQGKLCRCAVGRWMYEARNPCAFRNASDPPSA